MKKVMLSLAAAMAVVCVQAEAAVYTFTPTSIGPTQAVNYSLDTATFTLSLTDAIVRSGSFTYDFRYRYSDIGNPPRTVYQPSAVGDVQSLQSFQANNGSVVITTGNGPRGTGSDYFSVNLRFSATGQIVSGGLIYGDDAFNITVAGTSSEFSGNFGTGFQPQDSVVGNLTGGLSGATSVPEPATFGLVGAALAFLSTRRRR